MKAYAEGRYPYEDATGAASGKNNVQIFNIHIASSGNKVVFPTEKSELSGNTLGQDLYDFSSLLPERYNRQIADIRGDENPDVRHRAMAMNADMGTLVQLLDIGTPTNISKNL